MKTGARVAAFCEFAWVLAYQASLFVRLVCAANVARFIGLKVAFAAGRFVYCGQPPIRHVLILSDGNPAKRPVAVWVRYHVKIIDPAFVNCVLQAVGVHDKFKLWDWDAAAHVFHSHTRKCVSHCVQCGHARRPSV